MSAPSGVEFLTTPRYPVCPQHQLPPQPPLRRNLLARENIELPTLFLPRLSKRLAPQHLHLLEVPRNLLAHQARVILGLPLRKREVKGKRVMPWVRERLMKASRCALASSLRDRGR